ncbi:TetR/AcrR family transcriptional regulator [Luteimicrobium subarcticum]|uniref:TetR family transcriptional regulator n=1 Tax=Luteimicrobium subarcticum TaxID=620910 RepID=A0A2M8WJ88_9MICO|nr:TetR/AcrR family transcriptional regulator [Luteimicrobium subarcticum]PJI90946.1 TetR family transcriptional regulator [Luteimicrobium subarcticum]
MTPSRATGPRTPTPTPARLRRDRERAERAALIVRTAREIAGADGWDAVTTRRLADTIGYSQPVLYSHFAGRDAIVAAVAEDGFVELATALRNTAGSGTAVDRARAVATAYLDFAREHPALYDAMFTLTTSLAFGTDESPRALVDAFDAVGAVRPAHPDDVPDDAATELTWSILHGLALLERSGRLRPALKEARLALLLDLWGRPRP